MRVIVFVLPVLAILFLACRKNKFVPCEDFGKIVGDWKSIDTEFEDKIIIIESGIISICPATERKRKYKTNSCAYIANSQNLPPYYRFSLKDTQFGPRIFVNQTFDTISHFGGAYNKTDILDTLGALRRYVRIN